MTTQKTFPFFGLLLFMLLPLTMMMSEAVTPAATQENCSVLFEDQFPEAFPRSGTVTVNSSALAKKCKKDGLFVKEVAKLATPYAVKDGVFEARGVAFPLSGATVSKSSSHRYFLAERFPSVIVDNGRNRVELVFGDQVRADAAFDDIGKKMGH